MIIFFYLRFSKQLYARLQASGAAWLSMSQPMCVVGLANIE